MGAAEVRCAGKGCGMQNVFPLSLAQANQRLVVVSVDCEPSLRSRLCDLGLAEGSSVTYLYPSAFGDPCAYLVKGAVLGIRKGDAEKILCRKEEEV